MYLALSSSVKCFAAVGPQCNDDTVSCCGNAVYLEETRENE